MPLFQNTVLTIGSFDGVHKGHQLILEKVQALAHDCKGESVVITFDPHPRTVLHPNDEGFKLVTTTDEKIRLLEACGVDNLVIVPFTPEFSQMHARAYVEDFLVGSFHPRYIVIGYDHRFGNNREGGIDFLKAHESASGYTVVEIPAREVDDMAVSSSKIRKALESSDILHANRLLGYPYTFSGKVIEGRRIGRTIGFPTANLAIEDKYKLVPPNGIYAARAGVGERWYDAMLYIGHRPTTETNGARVIEINLLGFDGDLYGAPLLVEVLDFIRPDRKLDGLDALKAQIEQDKRDITARLANLTSVHPGDVQTAVVILNYNTRRHLEQFLPSVVANSEGARIIVADNGSPDDSIAFVRTHYPEVELIDLQHNYGFAGGYNLALAQVKADIYVILNSDVEVHPGWIEPVLDAFKRDPNLAIAQPKILGWPDKTQFEYAGAAGGWIDALGYPFCRGRIFSERETDHGQYDTPQPCFWAAGAAFFIRAELYHTFEGFDADYFAHNEEIDLCWRLKRAGYSVWCLPESIVYHLGGGTLQYDSPRKVFLNFRNSLYTLLKNESGWNLLWLMPARMLLDGVAGLRFLLQGRGQSVGAIIRAHFSFYRTLGATLRKRKHIARLIRENQVQSHMDSSGIFKGSIVWQHYIKQIKTFTSLFNHDSF